MASVTSRHIDNVISVGLGSPRADAPGAMYSKSWARCIKQHGLDPTRPTPARILPSHQVREHRQRMESLLRVARAGMEDMYRRVADLGYMLLLTDADGITVDYIGNPASEKQLKAAGLYLGADWNEAHAGTCGVGTCLIEQTTITCHQAEHFDATHIALTCTSSPLFAPDGQLLGVLDVSALHSPEARESQHLALQLTSIYAQRIEDANFLRHFTRHAVLRLGTARGLVEVAGDLMFAFDADGVIVGANTGARRRFGVGAGLGGGSALPGASRLVGHTLEEALGIDMDTLRTLTRGGPAAASATVQVGHGEPYFPAVIAPRATGGSSSLAPLHDLRPAVRPATAQAETPRPAAPTLDRLLGDDPLMQRLVEQARRLVDRQVNLLICGETGSGKEVLARALHAHSRRAARPFVAVNCAAIPESLIESELFGYTAGSFTGGRAQGMKGLIAQADGGTLFLDEIGDMPLHLQTRFLRVLSENEVLPLGAERPVAVQLNVMAATHRQLRAAVDAGTFREDLYYRLCGATLQLPPLRERADCRYLIDTVFDEEAQRLGCHARLTPRAMQLLLAHPWPGNVRELRNALRYAIALCGDRPVTADDLPPEIGTTPMPLPKTARRAVVPAIADTPEATRLLAALQASHWNITATAVTLNVCRATVYRQMKRLGITPPHLQ